MIHFYILSDCTHVMVYISKYMKQELRCKSSFTNALNQQRNQPFIYAFVCIYIYFKRQRAISSSTVNLMVRVGATRHWWSTSRS